jgi:excisionase family DNA binding protein
MHMAATKRYISLGEAAERYGVSIRTIRRRISAGELKAIRFGPRLIKVDPDDLDAMGQPMTEDAHAEQGTDADASEAAPAADEPPAVPAEEMRRAS